MEGLTKRSNFKIKHILSCLAVMIPISVCAQETSMITGKILEEKSDQPIPFATVCLIETSGTAAQLMTGTVTNDNGIFTIERIPNGTYKLQVTSIGYQMVTRMFDISVPDTVDAGTLYLQDSLLFINEVVVVANRARGKSEAGRTIYYINNKMLSATGNAPELLRHIPGVQVDLKQNISVDGQTNILLFVDGKEHDRSFISQLDPSQIDRIEVLKTPPSNYDANVSGVINIVLKKEKASGFSGHLFTEIPVSSDVVYMFPAYSLNYNFNKINFYTSYNGEINYEDIVEKTSRQVTDNSEVKEISSVQYVRQKNLSHKFHYGIDYNLTSRDIINFYGFYNHYSYEQDGNVVLQATGDTRWEAYKEETDKNRNLFSSVYYKHMFRSEGGEITVDLSNAYSRSGNEVLYRNDYVSRTNSEKPEQATTVLKVDFTNQLNEKLRLSTGAKFKTRSLHDSTSGRFSYSEQVYALYGTINYKLSDFDFNGGMRAEGAETKLSSSESDASLSLLPYISFHYKLSSNNDLYLSYRRSVNRPSVYLLNPYSYTDDPYTIRKGNPSLRPEFNNRVQFEYSARVKSSYISAKLFYETKSDVINNLTYLNDSNLFVTQVQNSGDIHEYGLQLTGALKFGILSINPSFRLYNQLTRGNNTARLYGIEDKANLVFESGISSILSFRKDFAFSVIFQYSTVKENIQDSDYCGALYFIALDKTFKKNLKVGIVTALPFARSFVYQGSDIRASNFTSEYTGNLKLPAIPLMFRVTYNFNSGTNRTTINREKEVVDTRPKQGF